MPSMSSVKYRYFPKVLEGFGSSGKLVGTITTHPHTYKVSVETSYG